MLSCARACCVLCWLRPAVVTVGARVLCALRRVVCHCRSACCCCCIRENTGLCAAAPCVLCGLRALPCCCRSLCCCCCCRHIRRMCVRAQPVCAVLAPPADCWPVTLLLLLFGDS